MAKAFYTQDEATSALNTDEDGLKDLVREGRLTEYRDGQNLMYKGTQVEALAGEMGRGDEVNLSDTGGPIGLADSAGASGGAIDLADSGPPAARSSAGGSRPAPTPPQSTTTLDDTGTGFSLSDSDAGVDPVQGGGTFADSASMGSASGITIFGPDDSGVADAGAVTSLGDTSGEQVNLEGIGSGSGLLDLTQEPDDTSFGAETFDEIGVGESAMGTAVGTYADDDEAVIDAGAAPVGTRAVGAVYEPYDPSAPLFGGLAAGAAVATLLGLLAVATAALGADFGFLSIFFDEQRNLNLPVILGVLLGLPILGLIVGLIGGRMASA